jgi:hypothetical protein
VTWNDAVAFAQKLSDKEGLSGESAYRLPTEAEWEYAARAGQGTKYAGSDDVDAVAWHKGNSGSKTHPVGQKPPNAWGLYDMTGNVFEWTLDWYGDYLSDAPTNPKGASDGSYRVKRGGSWFRVPRYARVALRFKFAPKYVYYDVGLRLLVPSTPEGTTSSANEDTGFQSRPRLTRSASGRRSSQDNNPPKDRPKKPGKPSVRKGKVRITIRDAQMATKVELRCPGGYRKRSSFSGRVATFSGVPPGSCQVHFFGSAPARFRGVKSGDSLTCSLIGTTAQCR